MFENCISLTSLDFTYFNTQKVVDARYMLTDCTNLKIIDFSNFDSQKLDYYEGIFSGLTSEGIIKYNSSIFNETILNLLPEDWTKEDINQ